MFCITYRVDDSATPDWQTCLDEIKDNPPVGNPVLFNNRHYTFKEMVTLAYDKKILTDKEGLKT